MSRRLVLRRPDEAYGSPVYTNAGHLGENRGMRILIMFFALLKSHLTIPGSLTEDPTQPRDDRSGG